MVGETLLLNGARERADDGRPSGVHVRASDLDVPCGTTTSESSTFSTVRVQNADQTYDLIYLFDLDELEIDGLGRHHVMESVSYFEMCKEVYKTNPHMLEAINSIACPIHYTFSPTANPPAVTSTPAVEAQQPIPEIPIDKNIPISTDLSFTEVLHGLSDIALRTVEKSISVIVIPEDSGATGAETLFAAPSAKGVAAFIRYVRTRVQNGNLEPAAELNCAFAVFCELSPITKTCYTTYLRRA